jgi:hypothetical protein
VADKEYGGKCHIKAHNAEPNGDGVHIKVAADPTNGRLSFCELRAHGTKSFSDVVFAESAFLHSDVVRLLAVARAYYQISKV